MRKVTERDLRMPEFQDANLEDLEFRSDGKIVRKDRWEMAIQRIRELVGINAREFEIPDVVAAVRALVARDDGWIKSPPMGCGNHDDWPSDGTLCEIRLSDGSQLKNAVFVAAADGWRWGNASVIFPSDSWVIEWREQ